MKEKAGQFIIYFFGTRYAYFICVILSVYLHLTDDSQHSAARITLVEETSKQEL